MIRKILFVNLIFISNLLIGQNTISKTVAYDSIVKSLHYKNDDKITVYTHFEVNNHGEIINIKARGPHQIFEEKAIKMVKDIQKYNPKIIEGKPSDTEFNMPIVFIITLNSQGFS